MRVPGEQEPLAVSNDGRDAREKQEVLTDPRANRLDIAGHRHPGSLSNGRGTCGEHSTASGLATCVDRQPLTAVGARGFPCSYRTQPMITASTSKSVNNGTMTRSSQSFASILRIVRRIGQRASLARRAARFGLSLSRRRLISPVWDTRSRPGYSGVMADSSFDIVSKVDHQEAENALNQARKEIEQRYDFKGTGASIAWSGESILIIANTEERAKAVLDVFQSKLIKRGISLKSLDSGEPFASGKEFRIVSTLKDGISSENAKKINKIIRDEGPKGVKSQIQGDELRVQSKSRDDLQSVIALLKGSDLDVDLQFINYR